MDKSSANPARPRTYGQTREVKCWLAVLANFSRHSHHRAPLPFEIDKMSKDRRLRRCIRVRHLLLLRGSECSNTLRIDSDMP